MRIAPLRMILNQRALIPRMGAINLQRRNRACNGPRGSGRECAWGVAPPLTILPGAYGRISFLFMSACEQYVYHRALFAYPESVMARLRART